MKIGILTFQVKHGRQKGSIGSSMIRGDWLADKWPEAEIWHNGGLYEAIIFQKVYWKTFCNDYDGVKILDLCDPDWIKGELQLKEFSGYIDAITCSSKELTDFVRKIVTDKPVIHIPDRLNLDHFKNPKKHEGRAKYAVWFGYKNNANEVLNHVMPALKRNGLDLIVVSNEEWHSSINYGVNIINLKWTPETAFTNIKIGDIALNPRSMKSTFKYKSNNKTIISWALGLPCADTADDLERFLDEGERIAESERCLKKVRDEYDIMTSIDQYKKLIDEIYAGKKGSE